MVLVPVFRLVNLGIPVFFEGPLSSLLIIYGVLLPALFLLAGRWGHTEIDIGLLIGMISIPLVVPLGLVLAELEYLFLQPDALIVEWTTPQLVLLGVIMIGFVALVEELIFRGFLQRELETYFGRWQGLILASGLFALMHAGHSIPEVLLVAFCVGILFGYIYDRTKSLAAVVVLHGIMNVFLFGILPTHGSIIGQVIL